MTDVVVVAMVGRVSHVTAFLAPACVDMDAGDSGVAFPIDGDAEEGDAEEGDPEWLQPQPQSATFSTSVGNALIAPKSFA